MHRKIGEKLRQEMNNEKKERQKTEEKDKQIKFLTPTRLYTLSLPLLGL